MGKETTYCKGNLVAHISVDRLTNIQDVIQSLLNIRLHDVRYEGVVWVFLFFLTKPLHLICVW